MLDGSVAMCDVWLFVLIGKVERDRQPFISKWTETTVCLKKNDTDVAHYNFNADQPILIILGRDVAERVCYQMVICYPTSPN